MARRDQPLYRDTDDKMVGGVCSGLAHYFDIDTTLVRVAFAALTFAGGSGPLAYLILWAVLETAPPRGDTMAEPVISLTDSDVKTENIPMEGGEEGALAEEAEEGAVADVSSVSEEARKAT